MNVIKKFTPGNVYQGRLKKKDDIIPSFIKILEKYHIRSGTISAIGAISSANLAYFNQQTKQYEEKLFQDSMEVISLRGNISVKDGIVFPHIHIVLAKSDFSTISGHLMPNSFVYALEYEITEFNGDDILVRQLDQDTGLYIWNGSVKK